MIGVPNNGGYEMFQFLSRASALALAEKESENIALKARVGDLQDEIIGLKERALIRIEPECDRVQCDWLRASASQVGGIAKMVIEVKKSTSGLWLFIAFHRWTSREREMRTACLSRGTTECPRCSTGRSLA